MKNVSRNKFLLCFRPVVDMDLMLESKAVVDDRSQNQKALTNVGVKNKEDMKPSKTKSSVSDTKNSIMIHRPGKKTFCQIIKAVVFEIILVCSSFLCYSFKFLMKCTCHHSSIYLILLTG